MQRLQPDQRRFTVATFDHRRQAMLDGEWSLCAITGGIQVTPSWDADTYTNSASSSLAEAGCSTQ